MSETSQLEEELFWQITMSELPKPGREVRFWPGRQFRFDFAWGAHMIAVEVEGIGGKRNRHLSRVGYTNDCEKYNGAALLGWTVLRFTGSMVKDGTALTTIEQLFERNAE